MNQDINVELLLELDDFFDFLFDGLDIVTLRNPKENSAELSENIQHQILHL